MNRDHLLFLLVGILGGFIAGYVAHEVMAARQPVPAFAGGGPAGGSPVAAGQMPRATPPQGQGGGQGAGQSAGQGPASSAAPAMAEVGALRQRLAENPEDYDAMRRLGNLHYDIGNWGRAAELYAGYLEGRPDDVDVATDLGAAYRNMGRHEDAIQVFRAVRERQPDHWQALYNEILVLAFDLGRLDEAGEKVDELRDLRPGNPDVERLAAEVERRRAAS